MIALYASDSDPQAWSEGGLMAGKTDAERIDA